MNQLNLTYFCDSMQDPKSNRSDLGGTHHIYGCGPATLVL